MEEQAQVMYVGNHVFKQLEHDLWACEWVGYRAYLEVDEGDDGPEWTCAIFITSFAGDPLEVAVAGAAEAALRQAIRRCITWTRREQAHLKRWEQRL